MHAPAVPLEKRGCTGHTLGSNVRAVHTRWTERLISSCAHTQDTGSADQFTLQRAWTRRSLLGIRPSLELNNARIGDGPRRQPPYRPVIIHEDHTQPKPQDLPYRAPLRSHFSTHQLSAPRRPRPTELGWLGAAGGYHIRIELRVLEPVGRSAPG